MQVFGQLQSYVLSSMQQSLVAGFEWDHALHTGFECSLVGSRSLVLLGGWAGGSVYSWHTNSVELGKRRLCKTWRKGEFYSNSVS